MPERYLVAYEDGYLSEIKVAFTNEALADEHAEETGGTVVPITVLARAPKRTTRYHYTTTLDSPSGIVKRRDLDEVLVWEYENPFGLDDGEIKTMKVGGFRGSTKLVTVGYDKMRTAAAHEQAIKDNRGIDL